MAGTTFGYVTPENLALFTDRYELSMMQGYLATDHAPRATFDLFVRELPPDRGYLIAAGLEQAIHYLETLTFGDAALDYLGELGFDDDFLAFLAEFEFTGEVRAIPEGTPVFPDEPLIEITAPIHEAQLFETLLINQIGFQSLVATKAARMRDTVERSGDGQALVDFGSRRGHGTDAGMKAARAAYVGGFTGTSNLAAGEAFGIPVFGTMAHSWVQSFPTERAAYEAFVDVYGEASVLLVDTYDTVEGARIAADVARERGVTIEGVRLDSGDLAALSKRVTEAVGEVDVFVSSGVDEYAIADFFDRGGVAAGFGPGTALVTSADAPMLEAVYKLVAVERDGDLRPTMKLSTGKVTYPGRKSVRRIRRDGAPERDQLALRDEDAEGEELLVPIFEDGTRTYDPPALDAIRDRTLDGLRRLPVRHRRLRDPEPYPVDRSSRLRTVTDELREELRRAQDG